MRKFAVSIFKKEEDPEKSVWKVIYARKAKDYEGKTVFMADDHESKTLEGLRDQERSLEERQKNIKEIIKAIEKANPKEPVSP